MTERDNSGVLFQEAEKKSEKHPDYTGNITIDGTRYRLAAWTRQGGRGPYLKLAVSEDRRQPEQPF